ncbi:MAG TPA: hypothetical protein VJ849_02385 [Actinomycetes bacterium]|nr:hypothetical protein [Actinomycetes bacterium]
MRPGGENQEENQVVACRVVEADHPEVREFLSREWPRADRHLFGRDMDGTSRPVVVEARAGRDLAGVALGETVAGMARLHDLLVTEPHQGRGLGWSRLRPPVPPVAEYRARSRAQILESH